MIYIPKCVRTMCATLVLAAAAVWSMPACAAPDALIRDMQQNYSGLQSFEARFTQKLVHNESGAEENRNGVLYFKRPLSIRWETKSPSSELLLVTDQGIWNYRADEKVAHRYSPNLANDSRSIARVITGQSRLDQDFMVTEVGRDRDLVVLQLYPNEPTTDFTEGKLWVNPGSRLIHRADITDFYGNVNSITLEYVTTNGNISNNTFIFTPPAGVRVEDAATSSNSLLR